MPGLVLPAPDPRRGSFLRRALLLLALVVLGALLLEAAARVRLRVKYGRATTEIYASSFDPVSGVNVPLPNQDAGFVHINALGFRGPDLQPGSGAVRIAFLGGSTTFCAEASGDAATWPALVTRGLESAFGVPCEYVNGGLPGIGLKEMRRILEHRVRALKPDVIVLYEATNDLSRDTRLLAEQAGLFTSFGDERSLLARISVAWDLIEKNLRLLGRQRAARAKSARLEYDPERLARDFRSEMEGLIRDAQAVAPIVVVITFSIRLRPEQDAERRLESASTSLYYMPYMSIEGLLDGFAAYNRAIRAAAATTGAILVDGENAIPGDATHFNDSVHFTDAGCRAQAERVLRVLEASESVERLFTRRLPAPRGG